MSTSSELETKILEDFLHYFLPEGLLDYFEPVMAEDKEHHIKQDEVYKRILHRKRPTKYISVPVGFRHNFAELGGVCKVL